MAAGERRGAQTAPTAQASVPPGDAALSGAETAVASRSEAMAAVRPSDLGIEDTLGSDVDELVGQVLAGRYEITRKIGAGGMGAVFEATHRLIGKRVAVKVLLKKYADKDSIIARLGQEARLASSIGHENIIDITDFGQTHTGSPFVVMEYLEGESLAACLGRDGPLPLPRILHIARQITSALGAAHQKGIIHRDVKPENVFLVRRSDKDFIKVVDFGISKSLRPSDAEADESPRLTQTGMVLGTPLYMSPEQARGDETLDHRIDLYALGVILYECATGEVPFRGGNYLHIISQVLSEDPRPPRTLRPELSEAFEAVILKALAKDQTLRYQTAEEFDADLAALQTDRVVGAVSGSFWAMRRKAQRRGTVVIAAWIGAIAVVGAAAVVTAMALLGRVGPGQGTGAAAGRADAGAVSARIDAAPRPPKVSQPELVKIAIISHPPGATVWSDGGARLVCPATPCEWTAIKKDSEVELILELDGYDDRALKVNPYVDHGQPVEGRLTRTKRGVQSTKLRTEPAATPTPDNARTDSELQGNPFRHKQPGD
jgi:serine/threonine-protein kinase